MRIVKRIAVEASLLVISGDFVYDPHTHQYSQQVRITNNGNDPALSPVRLALDNLSANATQLNADGTTQVLAPLGSPTSTSIRATARSIRTKHGR